MKVRKLACALQQDLEIISVGRIGDPECLFMKGSIYIHGIKMLVDTKRKVLLTVATGKSMEVQGECHLELKLGEVFEHYVVVPSIT